jgi:glycosyltransferase involved in cell wall biosynthesis
LSFNQLEQQQQLRGAQWSHFNTKYATITHRSCSRSSFPPTTKSWSFHRQSQPSAESANEEHEIIVVDDASDDGTAEIAREGGAQVVSIKRRQIAASRNAGARIARGDILFFVDADTRINSKHVSGAIAALEAGYAAGSARVEAHGPIPLWGRVFLRLFCALYFSVNLGAGAFLFATRKSFEAVGGFDETLFVGEEVYFSLAMKKLGRFTILREPIITSGRKLRMYSAGKILSRSFSIILRGRRGASSRCGLDLWYDGKRETRAARST